MEILQQFSMIIIFYAAELWRNSRLPTIQLKIPTQIRIKLLFLSCL